MKRLIILFILVMVALVLTACSEDSDAKEGKQPTEKAEKVEKKEEEKKSNKAESQLAVVEFKDIEQIEGDEGEQLLTIEVDYTNKDDEPSELYIDSMFTVKAEQDTEDTVDELDIAFGSLPDDYKPDLQEMTDKNVKPGATVTAILAYEILYPGEPVRLTNPEMGSEEVPFEKIIETNE